MHPMLNVAIKAVREAGNLIIKYYEIPYVKNIDKLSEKVMVNIIHKFYPKHPVFTEGRRERKDEDENIQWFINPLDSIDNFSRRLPHFAISAAVCCKGRTEVAVVYDPIRNELFTTSRGQGAQLNGHRLRCNSNRDLNDIVLVIDTSLFKVRRNTIFCMEIFEDMQADFRFTGSSLLDLVYVAAGRVDGYFRIGSNPCDFIASELVVRESGALICDITGNYNYVFTGNILAGSAHIVKTILMSVRNNKMYKTLDH